VGEEAAAVTRFAKLPARYDAAAVSKAIEDLARDMERKPPALETPAFPSILKAPFPSYTETLKLGLDYRHLNAGSYGSENDPRISYVRSTRGSGLRSGVERFRFETGTKVFPLLRLPTEQGSAVAVDIQVAFGLLVVGVPHRLNRLPEFVLLRSSATERGPAGQKLQITGGAASLGSGYVSGDMVRADLDFVPILGQTQDDIESKLRYLFHFETGATPFGTFDYSDGGFSDFELPKLEARYLAEMVTTEETFSGILLVTSWGLPTFQGGWSEFAGGALTAEVITHRVFDTIQGHPDQMVSCHLVGLGKSLWAMRVPRAAGALQAIFDDGLELTLQGGSVDFVMG
jgi:hypothetical protein